jgi:hypothetical protein
MKQLNSPEPGQPSLVEAIQRGWDWVVFVAKNFTRVGGVKAWLNAFQKMISIMRFRFVTPPPIRSATRRTLAKNSAGTCRLKG